MSLALRRELAALALFAAMTGFAGAADLERDARELEAMLIAPCCFRQQVSVHQSEAADNVRRDIRQRLAAGQSRDEILDAYVQQYGERVLAEPRAKGISSLLYGLPALGLILSGAVGLLLVRHFARQGSARSVPIADGITSTGPEGADERYQQQLDDALRDLD